MKTILFLLTLALSTNINAITIGHTVGFGTAITLLKHNGYKYLDNTDHGRSLQSAVSFDGLGECYNPTEAGSWPGAKDETSSKIRYMTSAYSIELMGYWYNPNEWCINEQKPAIYPTTSVTSDYTLLKKYTITDNILTINATFYSPRSHKSATFEALTAYVNEFNYSPLVNMTQLFSFDPKTGEEFPYTKDGEQKYPVVIASVTGRYAIGMFSPDLPEYYGPDLVGYGMFDPPNAGIKKLNCVFRKQNIPADSAHTFTCQVAVGTKQEVKDAITKLSSTR